MPRQVFLLFEFCWPGAAPGSLVVRLFEFCWPGAALTLSARAFGSVQGEKSVVKCDGATIYFLQK